MILNVHVIFFSFSLFFLLCDSLLPVYSLPDSVSSWNVNNTNARSFSSQISWKWSLFIFNLNVPKKATWDSGNCSQLETGNEMILPVINRKYSEIVSMVSGYNFFFWGKLGQVVIYADLSFLNLDKHCFFIFYLFCIKFHINLWTHGGFNNICFPA